MDKNKIKSLDIYRLDGDKDGIVCEALKKNKTEAPVANTGTEIKPTIKTSKT